MFQRRFFQAFFAFFFNISLLISFGSLAHAAHVDVPEPIIAPAISGTITNTDGEAITSGKVFLLDENGRYLVSSFLDDAGKYDFQALSPGEYYLLTDNNADYVDEIYPNEICGRACYTAYFSSNPNDYVGDSYLFGESVVVSDGTHAVANFELQKGVTFSGRVVDAETAEPISNAWVYVTDAVGWSHAGNTSTDSDGYYTLNNQLPSGSYYLFTDIDDVYINKTSYGDSCGGSCNHDSKSGDVSSYLHVEAQAVMDNIDFSLHKGGVISGRVIAAETNAPVQGAWVTISGVSSGWDSLVTDANGFYQSDEGFESGQYLVTVEHSDYIPGCYGNEPCADGAPIDVTLGDRVSGINVSLHKGGQISGRVVSDKDDAPIVNQPVSIYSNEGHWLDSSNTDSQGNYISNSTLPTGDYVVCVKEAKGSPGYLDDCIGATPQECRWCNLVLGSLSEMVHVTAKRVTSGGNFRLKASGGISGRIVDAESGDPISNATVYVYRETGDLVGYAHSNSEGNYHLSNGLKSGAYYLQVLASGYDRLCYGDVRCYSMLGSSEERGQAINIVEGSIIDGVNFHLSQPDLDQSDFGTIYGRVMSARSGRPIPRAGVEFISMKEFLPFSNDADERGRYVINRLTVGSYSLRTQNDWGHINTVYGGRQINGMYVPADENGDDIFVGHGEIVGNVDFSLSPGTLFSASVTDKLTGDAIDSRLTVFDINGNVVASKFLSSHDAFSRSRGALLPGIYYARIENYDGYIDEYYSGIPVANSGGLAAARPLIVNQIDAGRTINIEFSLQKGIRFSAKVDDKDSGEELSSIHISVYDKAGDFVGLGSVYEGRTNLSGLTEGEYYFFFRKDGYQSFVNNEGRVEIDLITCDYCSINVGRINVSPIRITKRDDGNVINFKMRKSSSIAGEDQELASSGGGAISTPFLVLMLLCLIKLMCHNKRGVRLFYRRAT
ncbi:carboxypeptidase regulatory-like domain-containing protein [Pseudomonadota bacterium]